jgi:hypothetical protein
MFNQMIQGGFSGIGYGYGNSYGNGRPPGLLPTGLVARTGDPRVLHLTVGLAQVVKGVDSAPKFNREYRTEPSRKPKPSP